MASQRWLQDPGDFGEPDGQVVAVLCEVERGVSTGREKDGQQQHVAGSAFDTRGSGRGDVWFGEFQVGRFDQVIGSSFGERLAEPVEIAVGRIESAAVSDE